jgi:hypothetical protein
LPIHIGPKPLTKLNNVFTIWFGLEPILTGMIDSTELRSRDDSSSLVGCGSSNRSRRSVSSMEDAMRTLSLPV